MDALLAAYLPQDRRLALARGAALAEHTTRAALFADISGFTPLTAAFDRVLGARRGAEELTRFIDQVYNALIAEIDRFGGSVIGFAGDGITCWFDDAAATGETTSQSQVPNFQYAVPLRAVAGALTLQEAIHTLAGIPLPTDISSALAIKVAVASGTARRFIVGDPTTQLLDVLAGDALARMAEGEQLAAHGEVLLDELSAIALSDHIQINAWRGDPETGARFAVVRV
jgi:adenylate cyclase